MPKIAKLCLLTTFLAATVTLNAWDTGRSELALCKTDFLATGFCWEASSSISEFVGQSENLTFVIYEIIEGRRILYIVKTPTLTDYWVTALSERLDDADPTTIDMVRREAVRFFVVRFSSIANDLDHRRWRPDVGIQPRSHVNGEVRAAVMMSINYRRAAAVLCAEEEDLRELPMQSPCNPANIATAGRWQAYQGEPR
jgi:hypothetical protein